MRTLKTCSHLRDYNLRIAVTKMPGSCIDGKLVTGEIIKAFLHYLTDLTRKYYHHREL